MSNTQLFLSVIGVVTTEIGIVLAFLFHLSNRMDRLNENFTNQVTTLLGTIHSVDIEVTKLKKRD
jgi:hypothetical protein